MSSTCKPFRQVGSNSRRTAVAFSRLITEDNLYYVHVASMANLVGADNLPHWLGAFISERHRSPRAYESDASSVSTIDPICGCRTGPVLYDHGLGSSVQKGHLSAVGPTRHRRHFESCSRSYNTMIVAASEIDVPLPPHAKCLASVAAQSNFKAS